MGDSSDEVQKLLMMMATVDFVADVVVVVVAVGTGIGDDVDAMVEQHCTEHVVDGHDGTISSDEHENGHDAIDGEDGVAGCDVAVAVDADALGGDDDDVPLDKSWSCASRVASL